MVKKLLKGFMAAFVMLAAFNMPSAVKADESMDSRAVWVSYLDFETYLQDKSESEFKSAFTEICNNALKNNLNTLIVHVRAFNDAVYPTANYPWAEWLSSDMNDPGYDPLEIMVDIAHDKGLKFEAWINPFRISLKTVQTQRFAASEYFKDFSQDDLIEYDNDGQHKMILNPASQTAQNAIVEGVREIVDNYDVDGIHFDDYFYVSGTLGNTSQQERKDNINKLVKRVYQTVKNAGSDKVFGISPQGNLDNDRNEGADIDTWLSTDGYVDYVMPQIYWTDQYGASGTTTMFSDRAKAFYDIWTNKNVDLKVGLALYKVNGQGSGDAGWSWSSNNLATQVQKASALGYNGYALFRYAQLLDSGSQTELNNLNNGSSNNNNQNTEKPTGQNGWVKSGNTWYYYKNDQKVTGWFKDEFQCWYLLDFVTGEMQTGWIAGDSTHWYYLNPANGIMRTGLQTIDGVQYLLENTGEFAGSMKRSGTYTVGNDTCTIAQNGTVISCQ